LDLVRSLEGGEDFFAATSPAFVSECLRECFCDKVLMVLSLSNGLENPVNVGATWETTCFYGIK
jgi:hypothetical protein